jgi:hypothetical protein
MGVAILTIALGLWIPQIYPADAHLPFKEQLISNPAQTAQLLSNMDLNHAYILLKTGSRNQPLLSVINRFQDMPESEKRYVSSDNTDFFINNSVPQSDLQQTYFEHRGFRWTSLVPPFNGGIGKRVFQLTGSLEGDATAVLAILEDNQIIVKKTLSHRDGRVDISCLVETRYNNSINILLRLENGEGVFITESIGWAPYSEKLLQSASLRLPTQKVAAN